MMISAEDVPGEEMDLEKMADKIEDKIISRKKNHKFYGIICIGEGLADKLPQHLKPTDKDKHGNIIMGTAKVGHILREVVKRRYYEKTGGKKKIVYKQIGYETRTTLPISFDVVLGSMLGFGAYKLYSREEFNSMVSVSDNFQIIAVPFSKLIDEKTLLTKLRDVPRGSDFFELKEALSFKEIE